MFTSLKELGLTRNFGFEIGALVLIDPLGNELHFNGTGFDDGSRVFHVGKAQVQVVRRLVDQQVGAVGADIEGHTTCVPGV